MAVSFTENMMNVHYMPKFFNTQEADDYLMQLKTLPFFTPKFKIRGKNAKPKRELVAYGDEGAYYSFSGTCIKALSWTPLMIHLREQVEKHCGFTFNYVLLNKYVNGHDYISDHQDKETALHSTFPIVVLSFGAERTIEFKKIKEKFNEKPISIRLEHGSLYRMDYPTNKNYTHGIPAEPSVQEMRISLTFRHIIKTPIPRKKLKLSPSTDSGSEPSISTTSEHFKNYDTITNDWLSTAYQETMNPIIDEWNLNQNTLLQIVMENNYNLRIHIRNFNLSQDGQLIHTKNGVIMTPATFYCFQGKIFKFNFSSVNESFVSNNQLLTMSVSEDYCLLQQIFPIYSEGFILKPDVLKLYKDQILALSENRFRMIESVIKSKFLKQLPNMILTATPNCLNHLSLENAKQNFLDCILSEIRTSAENVYQCEGCEFGLDYQFDHGCMMKSNLEKFNSNYYSVLIHFSVSKIVKNVLFPCSCHYNILFFQPFDYAFYMSFLEENM